MLLRSAEMQGPILSPDRPWEGSCAMPFGGGIHRTAHGWRCWYLADFCRVCLAFSDDGLHWSKPDLKIFPGTNILLERAEMDSFSVWPDGRGWVMVVTQRSGGPLRLLTSGNGIWWREAAVMPFAGDRSTVWFNPAKGVWTFNVRAGAGIGGDPRRIDRVESSTFVPKTWEPARWLRAELEDGADEAGSVQLYAVDVVPMDGRLLGLLTLLYGLDAGRPKLNEVCMATSADGDVWQRERIPTLTMGRPGSWNWGNVQSVTGGAHRVGGRLRLYASGRDGRDGGNGVCALGYRELVL